MPGVTGLHHVTAIAGDAQANLDFYVGVLGMRLVKRSVNQDDPGTYHLFYADGAGNPGTDLTFFPWPALPPVTPGAGLVSEVGLAIPAGSAAWWRDRLAARGIASETVTRRGGTVLLLRDPHRLPLALAETPDAREFVPWDASPVSADRQVLGLHGVRIVEHDLHATAEFLVHVLGMTALGDEDGWHAFGAGGPGSGRLVELREDRTVPRGRWGTGGVHHVAWRVPDDFAELAVRAEVQTAGRRPTEVIDRFWFKSVYFTEPGGTLFELATDGPGFATDEDPAHLGESLVLPPWLEPHRAEIERALPPLRAPQS